MNAIQIRSSVQAINKRERNIEDMEKRAFSVMADWLTEVTLQGKELIAIRENVEHGSWRRMFGNTIRIHYEKAKRYIRVAENIDKIPELKNARSMAQALALIAERSESESAGPPQRFPEYIEAITRAAKLVGFIERVPFQQWPSEGLTRLKEQMLPIAQQLWPDKFQS